MTCNVGGIEKPIRILVGIALIAAGAFGGLSGAWTAAAFVVGAVALVTGALGFCPAWKLLGINTCPPTPQGKG